VVKHIKIGAGEHSEAFLALKNILLQDADYQRLNTVNEKERHKKTAPCLCRRPFSKK
jgi:hypothetical protein